MPFSGSKEMRCHVEDVATRSIGSKAQDLRRFSRACRPFFAGRKITLGKWKLTYDARSVSADLRVPHRPRRWAERSSGGGPVATMVEQAERESIAPSHMTRVVRLNLLAPDIVETILDGGQGTQLTLAG